MRSNAGANDQLPCRASSSIVPTASLSVPVKTPPRAATRTSALKGRASNEKIRNVFMRPDTAYGRAASPCEVDDIEQMAGATMRSSPRLRVTNLSVNLSGTMGWTARERRILAGLRTPAHIQQYLDELDYDEAGGADSPRMVMRMGKAQCFSGVLFACAALRELGHPPRLMYIDAASDDGHCL